MYLRIGVLKDLAMFTGKHLCWSLFFNKYEGFKVCNFLKKRLQHKGLPVKFAKFLRTPFLQNTSGGCFWKYLMNSLFIAFENNEQCHFVVRIGSPALVSFYCVCFVSFYFFLFSYFFVDFTTCLGIKVSLSILKIKQGSCSQIPKWSFEG